MNKALRAMALLPGLVKRRWLNHSSNGANTGNERPSNRAPQLWLRRTNPARAALLTLATALVILIALEPGVSQAQTPPTSPDLDQLARTGWTQAASRTIPARTATSCECSTAGDPCRSS